MSIRAFRMEDLPVITDIANRAWKTIKIMSRDALGDEISDLCNPEGDFVTKGRQIEQCAAQTPENIFVCERNGKIVGFITFYLEDNLIGTINNNASDPDCGEKGVGQEMYQAVFEHFKSKGMKAAKVTTGLDYAHAPARKAYLRAGFDRELRSVTYYRTLD
ncbi:MAG: GNAT family N-acetyltransferase [Lentisphaeria bacterium]|nr:GNAT family N-acetyltransferase [Lentisphaeria bacterium]